MDLFGLISLDPSERAAFEERTAAYIADFYGGDEEDPTLDTLDDLFELDGDLGTGSVGPGDGVRVLSASVSVTDQTLPLGDTFGIDCEDIDPLLATFTLEFVYESDDPGATADEVAARPFSTEEFRRRYIDDFLKRSDGGGTSFFDLLCVSELRLPPEEGGTEAPTAADATPTAVPTVTVPPSDAPSEFVDDIFDIRRRSDELERACPPGPKTRSFGWGRRQGQEEFEVTFVYGVETSTSSRRFVGGIEDAVLDYVATNVLRCADDGDSPPRLRSGGAPAVGAPDAAGEVVRVRYPSEGAISAVSDCDPVTSEAGGCAVLSTTLYVTTLAGADGPRVHRDVLTVLDDALRGDAFIGTVPDVVVTSYLGPDPEAASLAPLDGPDPRAKARVAGIALASTLCVIVLVIFAAIYGLPLARRGSLFRVINYHRQRVTGRTISTSTGPGHGRGLAESDAGRDSDGLMQ